MRFAVHLYGTWELLCRGRHPAKPAGCILSTVRGFNVCRLSTPALINKNIPRETPLLLWYTNAFESCDIARHQRHAVQSTVSRVEQWGRRNDSVFCSWDLFTLQSTWLTHLRDAIHARPFPCHRLRRSPGSATSTCALRKRER